MIWLTYPRQHDLKMVRNPLLSHSVNVRLVFTPDVLWIRGIVVDEIGYTIREF